LLYFEETKETTCVSSWYRHTKQMFNLTRGDVECCTRCKTTYQRIRKENCDESKSKKSK